MGRPITAIALGVVAMSLITGMMQAQGVFAIMGLGGVSQDCPDDPTEEQVNHIADCKIDDLNDEEVGIGSSTGSTLFGMYNVLADQVGAIYGVIFPGLVILERAGVPGWITVGFFGNMFSLMITISIISFARGYGL